VEKAWITGDNMVLYAVEKTGKGRSAKESARAEYDILSANKVSINDA